MSISPSRPSAEWLAEAMRLADRYASVYSFHGDGSTPATRKELEAHLASRPAAEPLAAECVRMRKALDAIYNHNAAARAAVIQHYGLHHAPAVAAVVESAAVSHGNPETGGAPGASAIPSENGAQQVGERQTALQRYAESTVGLEEPDPVERLRFFCSFVIHGEDWLDVEMFFDDVLAERIRGAQLPPQAQAEPNTDAYLCYAWGETDLPCAVVAHSREQVREFFIREWLGDADSLNGSGEPILPSVMTDFDDHPWDDEPDMVCEFEIGGVKVTRVYTWAPLAEASQPSPPTQPLACESLAQDDDVSIDWQAPAGILSISVAPDGLCCYAVHAGERTAHGKFQMSAEVFTVLKSALDAAEPSPLEQPAIQACRPEDRAMLATPAGAELVRAATAAISEAPTAAQARPQSEESARDALQERNKNG